MCEWARTTTNYRMVDFTTLGSTDIWIRSDIVITVEQDDDDGTTSIITLENGKVIFVQESPLEVLIALGYKGRS